MQNVIQIAGVIDATEAQMLIDCGVHYLGFPLRLDVHKEDLSEDAAAAVIRSLPPSTCGILITYLDQAQEIAGLCHYLGAPIVQLHGDVSTETLVQLKALVPDLQIIKSLIVRENDLENNPENNLADLSALVEELAPYVDMFITDTFDPATGASGATGKTHDWTISRKLVELSPKPVILAGGLKPTNVYQAIRTVRPAGVDVHTGVEAQTGRKSRAMVEAFTSEARRGFAEQSLKKCPAKSVPAE